MPSRCKSRGCAPSSAMPCASAPCADSGTASMHTAGETPSIRRRLLALLLIPTALIAAAATYSAYRTSLAPIEGAYDAELLDTALAVASNLEAHDRTAPTLELTPDAVRLLRSDAHDNIYYRVSGSDGHFMAGDHDLAVPH